MRHAAPAPAVPSPPPDVERDEREDDDDDARGDFGELLPDLDANLGVEEELDEAALGDPSAELDTLPDEEALDDDTPNELELGPDSVDEEDESPAAGDQLGVEEAHRTADDEPEDTLPSDDEERDGIDDKGPVVNDLDLPGLDADAEGTDDEPGRFGGLVAATEADLLAAPVPWQLSRLAPERERCSSLCLEGGSVVAGSTDLLWLDHGRAAPVRIALDGTRIASLVLVGEERETVLSVTAFGRLVRRGRLASDAERLLDLDHMPELGDSEGESAELCQLSRATPRSLIGRAGSGVLFRSDDAGSTLRPLEPQILARALSPTGNPVVALARNGSELCVSVDAGVTFGRVGLGGPALAIATGEAPRVASAGNMLAIYDPERGVVVSTDAGTTFREVRGIASVSAGVVGTFEGRPSLWLALYTELRDTTRFVLVDAETGSAEVIATISGTGDGESDLGTSARIEQLAWDGERLFAAGEAGLLTLLPVGGAARSSGH